MKSRNSVFFIGRLTKQNELKTYQSQNGGGYVLKNTIAVRGEKKDETHFIDFTAWGKSAELLNQYTQKGIKIAISGSLIMETWNDKQTGQMRIKHSVKLSDFELIESIQGQGQTQQFQGATDNLGYPTQNAQNGGMYNQMPPEVQNAINRNNAQYQQQANDGIFNNDEISF